MVRIRISEVSQNAPFPWYWVFLKFLEINGEVKPEKKHHFKKLTNHEKLILETRKNFLGGFEKLTKMETLFLGHIIVKHLIRHSMLTVS